MKKGILGGVVSLVLLLVAGPAFAAGPYVGLEGGAVWLSTSSTPATASTVWFDLKFDTGWSIGAAGGYDFGTWRLEGELAYRSNDVKEHTDAGGTGPLPGDITSTALMVNAYYDFRTLSSSLIPYIGVGIGGANVSADINTSAGVKVFDDSDIVFAYQFVAGVAFPVSKQLAIDLNYRYFATTDPSLEFSNPSGVSVDLEYGSSNVFLGLRYSF